MSQTDRTDRQDNDPIAGRTVLQTVAQKLQFMHTFNGDGSKTAKIIKGTINHTNVDIQAILVWLIVPFYDFAVFDPLPLRVCINCSFFTHIC